MKKSEVFYFDVKKNDGQKGVMSVRAKNLQTAKDCVAKYPRIISHVQIEKEGLSDEMLANLTEPFECADGANFTVVDPEPQGRMNLSKF